MMLAAAFAAATTPGLAADITFERLANPAAEPQNWLMVHHDYNNSRHASLSQINRDTVKNLQLKFIFSIGGRSTGGTLRGKEESTPLVDDGFMYVTDTWSRVMKFDVRSGTEAVPIWRYDPKIRVSRTTRGLAMYANKIVLSTYDARLIALNRDSGELIWEVQAAAPTDPATGTPSKTQAFSAPPVAIKTAAKTGFPVDHIIGGIWSSSEEDVIPAGPVAKGYLAITTYPAGTNFPIHEALKKYILDTGKSDLKDPRSFGSVYYNSGIVHAIFLTEAIRAAQAKFGNRPINGEEGQWGLEHLNIDDKRLAELGVAGLMQPLKLSCLDHEGGGSAKIIQWDGAKWNVVSDWIPSDRQLLRPLIDAKASAYAQEKGITPRDCSAASG